MKTKTNKLKALLAGSALLACPALIPSASAADMIILGGENAAGPRVVLNDIWGGVRYSYERDADKNKLADLFKYTAGFDISVKMWGDQVQIDIEGATGDSALSKYIATSLGNTAPDDFETEFNIRRLSITLRPMNNGRVEVTVGAFGVEHGAGTEFSGLDNDIPVMGVKGRVTYDSKGSYVVATYGNIDIAGTVNVFERFKDFGDDNNFFQLMVHHVINEVLSGSLEYMRYEGDDFFRGALTYQPKEWANTSIILEALTRLKNDDIAGDKSAYLLALTVAKTFEILNERSLVIDGSLIYQDQDKDIRLPISDFVPVGASARLRATVPDLISRGNARVAVYLEAIKGLDSGNKSLGVRGGTNVSWGGNNASNKPRAQ
jgi:hypothetical protein